ncbi:hypothetical protein PIB30_060100 [Stylosanthes scabra]|uniref:RRM domain-containing protein n=1 Tax=Stylosanthes scabra TaxID=79078 RepID=A0ABU6RKT4_9FABA|nr:hypothetical protein [Stylosanthes scabra]
MSGVGRGKKSVREGETESQWRVVVRRKPSSHWRQGPSHAYNESAIARQWRGGHKAIEQGEHRRVERNTFTVFADNLPQDATYQWLWKVFSNTGKVVDIFLSRKIRKSNPLKFAFIRYRTREEMERTAEQLDGWIVWGSRVRIAEPEYRRSDKTVFGDTRIPNDKEKERTEDEPVKTQFHNRSYKDALLEKEHETGYRNQYDSGRLQTLVIKDWHTLQEVKMMGSIELLMTFDTVANIGEPEKSCYLFNHFIEVRRWTTGEVNGVRRKWLEVTGLPAHGVLVDSNVGPGIQALASVVIEEECFQIFFKEVGDVVPWMVEDEMTKDRDKLIMTLHESNEAEAGDDHAQNYSLDLGEQNNWQMGISREEASAEEDEVSKVGETQQVTRTVDDEAVMDRDSNGLPSNDSVGPEKRLCVDNSPTKTVTLEDDRRTEK